ncbi:MFS transporter [Loigolactobacillus jiayinensis]|uniref:MFS transporter n=1 Tax=Loigolactobacillus jiayinensis TaxID=2486016 RepID=A0ABW1R9Q9_9LACO|nr:MFS transporter [Loigolactobacillus jiayinensis]
MANKQDTVTPQKPKYQPKINAKIKDEDQPKLPLVFSIAMFMSPAVWIGPVASTRSTLIPQLFSQIDPAHKVWAVGILAMVASLTSAIANLMFGAFSDVTRSRMGKRKPFIIIGSIVTALSLIAIANIQSVVVIIGIWVVTAAAENAVAAAIYAQISDRIAPRWRGTISTFYGVGGTIVPQLFAILAAQFLGDVRFGLYVMAAIAIVLMIVHVLLANEKSNLDEPKVEMNKSSVVKHFTLPRKGARDYYLALFGKFFMVLGHTIITTYLLYIFTDYMSMNDKSAGAAISIFSSIMLFIGLIFALVSGVLADKLKRVKLPVSIATYLLGVAALFPLFDANPWTMYVYGVLAAMGTGIYNSVDGALNLDVLPSAETAGKDLGLINLGVTGAQMLGALVASMIVTGLGYHSIFIFSVVMEVIGGLLISRIRTVK